MSLSALLSWCRQKAAKYAPYITDTGAFIEDALSKGKRVVLEAQLGAMRDIDYGIFPYTSSSSTSSAYGPIGAGIPGASLDHVVGDVYKRQSHNISPLNAFLLLYCRMLYFNHILFF